MGIISALVDKHYNACKGCVWYSYEEPGLVLCQKADARRCEKYIKKPPQKATAGGFDVRPAVDPSE